MAKLTPDLQLLLQATKWTCSPGNNRDLLAQASLDFLTAPGLPALPDLERLAHAAVKCAAASRADLALTVVALREILALAQAEHKQFRAGERDAQAAAERKRYPAQASPADPWKARADL